MDFGLWASVFGLRASVFALWASGFGLWTSGLGLWALGFGLQSLVWGLGTPSFVVLIEYRSGHESVCNGYIGYFIVKMKWNLGFSYGTHVANANIQY